MNTIRIFLVDDEPQVRQGLRMRLEMEPDFQIVGESSDGCAALERVTALRPNVVLMDVDMPGKDGIVLTAELQATDARCAVVMVSMHDDPGTRARALAAGAVAFVGKHELDAALTSAIRDAASRSRQPERLCGWIGGAPADADEAHGNQTEDTK